MECNLKQLTIGLLFLALLISLLRYPGFWVITGTIIRKCWFIFFLGILIWCFFGFTGQGRSIVQEIDFSNTAHRKYVTLFVLWMWAFNSYLLSVYSLQYVNIQSLTKGNLNILKLIHQVTPAVCGLFPFFIAISCFLAIRESPDPGLFALMVLDLLLFIVFLVLSLGTLSFRMQKMLHAVSAFIFYTSFKAKSSHHDQLRGKKVLVWLSARRLNWLAHCLASIVISLYPIQSAKFFGPIGVVFIACSSVTILVTLIIVVRKWSIVPVLPILLLAILLFSAVSDNNRVAVLTQRNKVLRPSVDERFSSWIRQRNNRDTLSVTLIAAEGGGLRSAFWTYATLRELQTANPQFFRNLFAISSVSGGSIGSALFCAEHFTGYTPNMLHVPILNNDNLSPMLAALLFRELPQSLLPIDVFSSDRSKIMDETFDFYWRQVHQGNEIWQSDFIQGWNRYDSMPSLFINSIHVESGVSVVLSNLRFDTTVIQSTDFVSYLDTPLSLSCVVGLSARFPYLQPAAKFERKDGSNWGHLSDGGYFENSGLAVAYQLYLHLRKIADKLVQQKEIKTVKFNLLLLRNGQEPTGEAPANLLSELNSPFSTLINSWYTRGYSYSHLVHLAMDNSIGDRFYEITLQKPSHEIPIGWFLSARSRKEIIDQAKSLRSNKSFKAVIRSTR